MKISNPLKTSLLGATLTSLLVFVVLILLNLKSSEILIVTLVVFIISLSVTYIVVRQFLYSRIKQLYEIIYTQDKLWLEKKVQTELKRQRPLLRASKNIEDWARKNTIEIENLKMMSKYRQDFLGNVSHELKTPIFNIQGYLSTLLDGAWKDKAVAKKFMRKALNSADRLENLVQDLTSISELESGREKLTLKEFDIRLLILKTFESMEIKAKKRNVTLSLKRNPSGSSIVLADENMIHQVLVNLLENSIKYGKESGNTWINLVDIDGRIWIEVCDDGEGIEEEHHHRLFERFYRTDSARSRDLGGSGLGLAIAKHIIEAHGQKIDVSSTKGIGTTFSFSLETAS